MKQISQQILTGERALFMGKDLEIRDSIFEDGESPLKESNDLDIRQSIFKWKYPLWYCKNAQVDDTVFENTARSGIWYTDNISIRQSTVASPKMFRRCSNVELTDVDLPHAEETLWSCTGVCLQNVNAVGDYFCMNSQHISATDLHLLGNYAFDGASNIEVSNSRLLSKDSFWNCENVVVRDSWIDGEYIGWNSRNLTFINCTIESLQGFCYIDNLVLQNCRLLETSLAFEYCSNIDIQVTTGIDSVKNPISGRISAQRIGELIFDDPAVDPANTTISTQQ
jgi:hypothetical protein